MNILEIKKLTVGVLKDFNLAVKTGGRAILRGENGAGKTTLVNAIMGNPDYEIKSGKIIFNGADITNLKTDVRARLGIFFGAQHVPEIAGLSVMTFIKHSYIAHNGDVPMGEFMKKLKDAAAKLSVPDAWLSRSVNVGFSGGERKKLMFLHLLVLQPKLAILDEPDSGADKTARKLFGKIIDSMKDTTFLVISHQQVEFAVDTEINI